MTIWRKHWLKSQKASAMSMLNRAQQAAHSLDAVATVGEEQNHALIFLYVALARVDLLQHMSDIADFGKKFDTEINHVLGDHPVGRPLSEAREMVGQILATRGLLGY